MRVEFLLDTGFAGATHKEIVEIPYDCSEEDIEEMYQEWANNLLDKCWTILEGNDECNS